jgi:hypothetical protein
MEVRVRPEREGDVQANKLRRNFSLRLQSAIFKYVDLVDSNSGAQKESFHAVSPCLFTKNSRLH